MPNQVDLITKYIPLLDQKYQEEAKTAILDAQGDLVRETETAKTFMIPKMTLSGLADYDRNAGYVRGDQRIEWIAYTFEHDRNRKFTVDAADNMETAFLAYSMLASEFTRLHVAPEFDAYRLSKYATLAGHTKSIAINPGNILPEIVESRTSLVNSHVPMNDMVMFLRPEIYGDLILNDAIAKSMSVDKVTIGNIQMDIETWNNVPLIEVPDDRMYTAYEFLDGVSPGQEMGGFAPAPGAQLINFIMMSRSSVFQSVKRAATKVTTPEVNQNADGWEFGFRLYHDAFVFDNKANSIYANIAV